MTQILALGAFLVILVHDLLGGAWLEGSWSDGAVLAAVLGPLAILALAAHAACVAASRRLDRGAPFREANRAEWVLEASRAVGGLWFVVAVLVLGWPGVVRRWIGDLVLLDEAVAAAPMLALLVVGWASIWGVDRRVREAVMLRQVDAGREPVPPPGAAAFVLMSTRHHLLLVVVPVALVMAWTELVEKGVLAAEGAGVLEGGGLVVSAGAAAAVAQLAGIAAIVLLSPMILRRLWSTSPLTGSLRDALMGLARRYGVRLGQPLVWRTHGLMVNGAVLGVFWPARYLLLTDALLEHLSPEEIEAVAAHEVGHIRQRHMLWLAAAVIATLQGVGVTAHLMGVRGSEAGPEAGIALGVSLAGALAVFILMSRHFEWQADAFAVRHLSLSLPPPASGCPARVSEHAVNIMNSALRNVAEWNGVPLDRPSLRHGSIALRQRRLLNLVGWPVDDLPIDRRVRLIKRVTAAVLAAGLAAMFLPPVV
jgi:STE24 endopeptidase